MKLWIAIIPILLAPIVWVGARQSSKSSGAAPGPSRFQLTAVPSGSDTVYTFSELGPNGKWRERWLVTLNEKYASHWIGDDGTAWVLTSGPSNIWARKASGDTAGHLSLTDVPGTVDVDPAASKAVTLPTASEQLRLVTKSGDEVRITLPWSQDGLVTPVVKRLKPGETKDPLTELLSEPSPQPAEVVWPLKDVPLAVWRSNGYPSKGHLVQSYLPGISAHVVRSEHIVALMPTEVVRTPGGRILWFQFGDQWQRDNTVLDVLSPEGDLVERIDLLKLSKLATAGEARASMLLKSIGVLRNGVVVPFEEASATSSGEAEQIRFGDSSGRQYAIDIAPEGQGLKVSALASMNVDSVPVKEPTIPGSAAQTVPSDDGKFELSLKTLTRGTEPETQMTLSVNIDDPVQGRKKAQLWSSPMPARVGSVRVSNSGRVYALLLGKWPSTAKVSGDFALLNTWDTNGKQLGGLDVTYLKWFSSAAEAERGLDLRNMKIEMKGNKVETEVEGLPIPVWPIEQLSFLFNDGRIESLYIRRIDEHMPPIYMRGIAKETPNPLKR